MKSKPSASEVPGLWEVDGSLRDMYVFDMSTNDWAKLLVVASSYRSVYSVNGEPKALPSAAQLFPEGRGHQLLAIQIGAASVNCHFFVESELELDINPKEVDSAHQHDLLLEFAETLASALQKPIVLTPENAPESPILSFEPVVYQWLVSP